MIRKKIRKAIRPIRQKMVIESIINSFFQVFIIGNALLLLLSIISHFVVFPFVVDWMYKIGITQLIVGVGIGFSRYPKTTKVIHQADLLGLKERLQTSWEFFDDTSLEAILQRNESVNYLETISIKKLYHIHLNYKAALVASCILIVAIGLLFIPSKAKVVADQQERFAYELAQKQTEFMQEKDKLLEAYSLSDANKKALEETLKPLLEKLKASKTEEEALKQLSIAKDEIKKLEMDKNSQNLQQLSDIAKQLADLKKNETPKNKDQNSDSLNELMKQMKEALGKLDEDQTKSELEQKLKSLENEIEETKSTGLSQSEQNEKNKQVELSAEALSQLLDMLSKTDNANQVAKELIQSINELAQSVSTDPSISEMSFKTQEDNKSTANASTSSSSTSSSSASGSSDAPVSEGSDGQNDGQSQSTSQGQGDGQGSGQGQGDGSGQGSGQGQGDGSGQGSGSGQGTGQGQGSGAGRGTGSIDSSLYSPTRIGGSSEPNYVTGSRNEGGENQTQDSNNKPLETGGLVNYEELYRDYYNQAQKNINTLDVPIVMKDIILEYFSKLE